MSGGKAAGAGDGAPKKKLPLVKIAILALGSLLAAGGGYAGWTVFLAAPAEAHEGAKAAEVAAPDTMHVAAIDYSVAAENSYTYSLALSVMLNKMCGTRSPKALAAQAAKEMQSDGTLVHLSWEAAYRRMGTLGVSSCDYMISEITSANEKARAAQRAAAEAAKKAEGGGGH
ncbi:MAG TPA: hypothetical protein VMF90_18865 [Rhizobiaceae bacterium]|nr:hypothetical protein [Rhizobiaceae bacterium]